MGYNDIQITTKMAPEVASHEAVIRQTYETLVNGGDVLLELAKA